MEKPSPPPSGKSRPDCINSSNPYHECSDYCLRQIVEAREDNHRWSRVHPHCINASNPYHACSNFCFRRIIHAKPSPAGLERPVQEPPASEAVPAQADDDDDAKTDDDDDDDDDEDAAADDDDGYLKMTVTENQKLVFELRVRPSTILRFVVAAVCALLVIHLLGVSLVVVAHALI
ncbi:uncharacterized protein LOC127777934 [Oryza glaberrima]|uniref:uncharacterized protein LOC127777934 n=1 Tax=Oryza glaberrima TaxID=4538 RepID=UPI00224C5652|nr:uncharacterized protein LOC127777934 [Oryza glaberrima]